MNTAIPSLYEAAHRGNLLQVRRLLTDDDDDDTGNNKNKSPFDVTSSGHTVLHIACQYGHLDVVKCVLDHEPNRVNERHRLCRKTPLHYACFGGHTRIAEELIRHGAVVTAVDCCNRTPLDWARERNWTETVQFMKAVTNKAEKLELLEAEASLREWLESRNLFTEREAFRIAKSMIDEGIHSLNQVEVLTNDTIASLSRKWKLSQVQSDKLLYLHNDLLVQQDRSAKSLVSRKTIAPSGKTAFISHTGQDPDAGNFAAQLAEALGKTNSGFTGVFFDAYSLRAGVLYKPEIERNVKECHVFICILSKSFFFRYWCLHELDLALRYNKRIVPVYYHAEHCAPPKVDDLFREDLLRHLTVAKKIDAVDGASFNRWCKNIALLHELQGIRSCYKDAKGSEVAFVKQIVTEIGGSVNKND